MPQLEEQEEFKPFSWKIWKKLIPFIKPYRVMMIILLSAIALCALIDVAFPLLQQYAIDHFIMPKRWEGVWFFAGIYLGVILLQAATVYLFCKLSFIVEMRLGRDLKRATFRHLQNLSFSFYNTTSVGYLMARTMSDTGRIGLVVAWVLQDVLWAVVYLVGTLIAMFCLNWKISLLVIAVVPFIALMTSFFQKRILRLNRQIRKVNAVMTGKFNEGISGARTSKTLVIEDKNTADFATTTDELRQSSIRSVKMNALYVPLVLFFSSMATAVVLANGNQILATGIEVGTLSALLVYSISVFEPIQQISRIAAEIVATQVNIERVMALLEVEPSITDRPDVIEKYGDSFHPKTENWEPLRGDITFDHVDFAYPDAPEDQILSDFCLHIPAGTTVAIVGETGAGKSTLVNLACRFFEPTGGRILIDGVDYRERSQLWLQSSLGYVLQDPHLFSGTVRENLRYGKLTATDEEIEEAARMVSADGVIRQLEKGYDTQVGENGDRLSTGEKQLISFARAVLAKPRIFVLDEATSSIDTETEQKIQQAISTLLENRTSFLIAHRLSTISKADLILVVQDGRIVEQGTHKELLAKNGEYATLYYTQLSRQRYP